MKRAGLSNTNGFTLPIVILAISGLLLLAIAALNISKTSQKSAQTQTEHFKLNLALESAQSDAISMLSQATNRDNFITHVHQDASDDAEYYLVSWYDPVSSQWYHQPLYSGASLQKKDTPINDRYVAYDDTLDVGRLPISMNNLAYKSSDDTQTISFNAPRVVIEEENGNPQTSYSFWIEDLNGLLDYESLIYKNAELESTNYAPSLPYETSLASPSGLLSSVLADEKEGLFLQSEIEGRYEMKILDQRHLGFNILNNTSISDQEYPVDFTDPLGNRLENPTEGISNGIAHAFEPIIQSNPAPYALNPSIITSELEANYIDLKKYVTVGLSNTYELETVPHGHGYQNAGELKMNLNNIISRADAATTGDERELLVTELSDQIKNVRGFKDTPSEYQAIGISVTNDNVSNTRYGGLRTSESYTKTLAANIIDYADSNPNSISKRFDLQLPAGENITLDDVNFDASRSFYRGIESAPLLTDVAQRSKVSAGFSGGENAIEVRTFLGLYNPTNKDIQGYVKFEFLPSDSLAYISTELVEYPIGKIKLFYWNGAVRLSANEHKVIEVTLDYLDDSLNPTPVDYFGSHDFDGEDGLDGYAHYLIGASSDSASAKRDFSRVNICKLYWYGMNDASPPPTSEDQFQEVCGFQTPFRWGTGATAVYSDTSSRDGHTFAYLSLPLRYEGIVGDPRNNAYAIRTLTFGPYGHYTTSYANACFGGQKHLDLSIDRRMNIAAKFPDGYYNGAFGIHPPSTRSHRSTYLPGEKGYILEGSPIAGNTVIPYPKTESKKFIQPISNAGSYFSLGELGNIYDPAQWKDIKRQTSHNNDNTPDDESDSTDYTTSLSADYAYYGQDLDREHLGNYGGGITLAIGSPEFNAFDPYADPSYDRLVGGGREGYEASRLLDQFRVTESELRSLKSRINLNTAPKKVLQMLFAGFTHEDDEILGSFTRQPRSEVSSKIANPLVEGLTDCRGQSPFLSLSDIALARATLDGRNLYLFGEKALYQGNRSVTNGFGIERGVWSDEGREELFRRTNDLFTTKSRSYRIHIKAEYNHNGETRSATKCLDVTIQPQYYSALGTSCSADSTKIPVIKTYSAAR